MASLEKLRQLIISNTPSDSCFIVEVTPVVDGETFQLQFSIDWWPTLKCYRAEPVVPVGRHWSAAAAVGMTETVKDAFRDHMRRLYGLEHVSFEPDHER